MSPAQTSAGAKPRSLPAFFLAGQLLVLLGAWAMLRGSKDCSQHTLPRLAAGSSGGALLPAPAASGGGAADTQPQGVAFQTPHSRCQVLPDGEPKLGGCSTVDAGAAPGSTRARPTLPPPPAPPRAGSVRLPPTGQDSIAGLPYLFDTTTMPGRAQSCPHCPPGEDPKLPPCCGVCIFTTRRCDDLHPGRNRTQAAAKLLVELDPLLAVRSGGEGGRAGGGGGPPPRRPGFPAPDGCVPLAAGLGAHPLTPA